MKIIEVHTVGDETFATFRPDTAMLRNNDNFYVPFGDDQISCSFGFAARITSQGKFLEERFAGKCYEEIGCVVAFVNETLVRERKSKDLPYEEAYSFDHSIAVSPVFVPADMINGRDGVLRIGSEAICVDASCVRKDMDMAVSKASHSATLRTGDIVCRMSEAKYPITKGARIELSFGEGMPGFEFEAR